MSLVENIQVSFPHLNLTLDIIGKKRFTNYLCLMLQKAVEGVILDPKYHDIFTIVKGARNGAVYGAKVRFPHALVMIMLFRTGSLREKFHQIFKATRTHARNLAVFASIYKIVMIALKHYGSTPGKEGMLLKYYRGKLQTLSDNS